MNPEQVLRSLADIADPESRPVFVSVFADLRDPQYMNKLERREKEILKSLPQDRHELFEEAWASAKEALEAQAERSGTRSVAVFASPEHKLLQALGLAAPLETRLILDSSPYIRPLARYLDEHEPFLLVLLDGEDAALFAFSAAKAKLVDTPNTDPMPRHRSGGMSQARYQRQRDQVLNQFQDEVAERCLETMRESGIKRVIVAGPGQAKGAFVERAPKELKEAVIAVEDVDFKQGAADAALSQQFVEVAAALARQDSQDAVETLKTELKTGTRACVGAFDTLEAAQSGRVSILVVLRGHRVAAQKCEEHRHVFRPGATCAACGAAGATVDAINEAVEFVVQGDGEVAFVQDDPFLESVGGVAALLRY